jgi:hypothetical protein
MHSSFNQILNRLSDLFWNLTAQESHAYPQYWIRNECDSTITQK